MGLIHSSQTQEKPNNEFQVTDSVLDDSFGDLSLHCKLIITKNRFVLITAPHPALARSHVYFLDHGHEMYKGMYISKVIFEGIKYVKVDQVAHHTTIYCQASRRIRIHWDSAALAENHHKLMQGFPKKYFPYVQDEALNDYIPQSRLCQIGELYSRLYSIQEPMLYLTSKKFLDKASCGFSQKRARDEAAMLQLISLDIIKDYENMLKIVKIHLHIQGLSLQEENEKDVHLILSAFECLFRRGYLLKPDGVLEWKPTSRLEKILQYFGILQSKRIEPKERPRITGPYFARPLA